MTVFPICLKCKHLQASGPMQCAAFPAAIPLPILMMQHDHRERYPNDHGIRYEPRDAEAAKIEPGRKPYAHD
jgi:hypothetical protein